ncbi:MAG: anhydro-N-acetylmuramic acid kinase [Gemmatimonadetes bacterium]|nr:anhydro-N-acetylmuramic acid kinase [Gemmatimonadota bacterium]
MTERPTLAVGLMSGTSLDGMDAALVRFSGPTRAELLGFVQLPYSKDYRSRLSAAITRGTTRELALLHDAIAEWAVEATAEVLAQAHVRASDLDLIAFHGQTIWHEPPIVTWQLGEPARLAEAFGVRVVSGFRGRDLAAGGQGAPLVPIADVLLFGSDHPRALLNLGGMANVTWVARRAVTEGAFAFDTGPGMAVIDDLARLIDPALPYDVDGRLGATGSVNEALLAELLADEYFTAVPPKSTGRERFGSDYAAALLRRAGPADAVATAVALTTASVAAAMSRWMPDTADLLVSGGGRHHPAVMAGLEARLGARVRVRRFDEVFFSGDAKEAVAFALLGYLTIHGQPGNLPSATGARGPRVLGVVTPA